MTFDELVHVWSSQGVRGVREIFEGPMLIPLAPWDRPSSARHTVAIDRAALAAPALGPRFEDDSDAPTLSGISVLKVLHSAVGNRVPAEKVEVLSAAKSARNAYAHVAVGRSAQNDVIIDQASVSRFHADIRWSEGVYSVRDAKSRNGTLRNGARVVSTHGDPIRAGDVLTFGEAACLFCPLDELDLAQVFSQMSFRPVR